MRRSKVYLMDIIEAMDAIEEFVKNKDVEDFKNSDMISSAVIRKFEIIGEAVKNIPEDIVLKYKEIPWKKMAGMRDRLIHFYFGVRHDLVWRAIKKDLPLIKPLIQKIINELED